MEYTNPNYDINLITDELNHQLGAGLLNHIFTTFGIDYYEPSEKADLLYNLIRTFNELDWTWAETKDGKIIWGDVNDPEIEETEAAWFI